LLRLWSASFGGRVGLGLLGNDGLVHGEDIGDTRVEDLCAEGIAGGESTEADDEVRRGVLEYHNSYGEAIYLTIADESEDKVDLKILVNGAFDAYGGDSATVQSRTGVEAIGNLEVKGLRHEVMGGTCVENSVSRDQYVVFKDRVMRVVKLGHYAWEASVFAGIYGVETTGLGLLRGGRVRVDEVQKLLVRQGAQVLSPEGKTFLGVGLLEGYCGLPVVVIFGGKGMHEGSLVYTGRASERCHTLGA
jgi:hypothetical protein